MAKRAIKYPWISGVLLGLLVGALALSIYNRTTRKGGKYDQLNQTLFICYITSKVPNPICSSGFQKEQARLDEKQSEKSKTLFLTAILLAAYFLVSLKFPDARLRFVHTLGNPGLTRLISGSVLCLFFLPGLFGAISYLFTLFGSHSPWHNSVLQIASLSFSLLFLFASSSSLYFFRKIRGAKNRYGNFLGLLSALSLALLINAIYFYLIYSLGNLLAW